MRQTFQTPTIDQGTGAQVTIDGTIHSVHLGVVFGYSSILSINSAGTIYMLLSTPSTKDIHLRAFEMDTLTSEYIELHAYEAPTYSNIGTSLGVGSNLNRKSTKVSELQFYKDTVVTTNGTSIWNKIIPGSKFGGGEGLSHPLEWVLKRNTKYLFTLYNAGNATALNSINFLWFEHGIY